MEKPDFILGLDGEVVNGEQRNVVYLFMTNGYLLEIYHKLIVIFYSTPPVLYILSGEEKKSKLICFHRFIRLANREFAKK